MKDDISKRVLLFANHINNTHDTIRKTAKIFGYSKSTIHNDLSKKLKRIDPVLYEDIRVILEKNFSEKHLRGGEATKKKYLIKKEKED